MEKKKGGLETQTDWNVGDRQENAIHTLPRAIRHDRLEGGGSGSGLVAQHHSRRLIVPALSFVGNRPELRKEEGVFPSSAGR